MLQLIWLEPIWTIYQWFVVTTAVFLIDIYRFIFCTYFINYYFIQIQRQAEFHACYFFSNTYLALQWSLPSTVLRFYCNHGEKMLTSQLDACLTQRCTGKRESGWTAMGPSIIWLTCISFMVYINFRNYYYRTRRTESHACYFFIAHSPHYKKVYLQVSCLMNLIQEQSHYISMIITEYLFIIEVCFRG